MKPTNYTSSILKVALFATGLAGIVAEYTLSTLATYFLGDSVFQWTMIVSIMLFSMGLGSKISKWLEKNLLEKFVWLEFSLSIVASNVTIIVYVFFALYDNTTFIIYLLSVLVGLLIGMEIPLVVRLNERFQNLKVNISSALENDYFGSLAGGVFFAFLGLPYLGLTYTPLILGIVNFSVAMSLVYVIWNELEPVVKKRLIIYSSFVLVLLVLSGLFAKRIVEWGDRIRYQDPIVYSEQSRYQKIVLTYAGGDYWLFLNGHQQLSTFDEALYHEPLVHPLVQLHPQPLRILILGGGDGAAARELLKYDEIASITLVDLDPSVTNLAMNHPVLVNINQGALSNEKVEVINQDGFTFLEGVKEPYDLIIADFPDPRTVDLGRLYSKEFYWLCRKALNPEGLMITQAGSPYYAKEAFECIDKTMASAGFHTLQLHNHVLTLGEWGWVIGSKLDRDLKEDLKEISIEDLETKWLTNEALTGLVSFGKQVFKSSETVVDVNQIHSPVLYKYYLKGRWDLY
ncbi:MAG: polyamine aminopropyltransferase [Ekhidna sp.]|nr:polyamine aminopropyltransferase [Ekhidna sp.]